MEAKDTVMKSEIVSPKFPDYIPCAVWDILEAQAEVTWKIAQEEKEKQMIAEGWRLSEPFNPTPKE